VIARYVLILRHPDGRREPYVHDANAEAFGVGSQVTIEGRCWQVMRPHVIWRGRKPLLAPNTYDCEPCREAERAEAGVACSPPTLTG
jgi:hypothetical protein